MHAFSAFGGVPFGRIRYDNLKSAVSTVLGLSRHRVENERWLAFRSHYGFEAFYCQPGIEGAGEKGAVEARWAGFGVTTSCRSRRSNRSPNSTP